MANTGCTGEARPLAERFLEIFSHYDYVVAPSGSCVAMVRCHYDEFLAGRPGFAELRPRRSNCASSCATWSASNCPAAFPTASACIKAATACASCGWAVERAGRTDVQQGAAIAAAVDGIELVTLQRPDECCGFGGTFAVAEEAVSCMMGRIGSPITQRAGARC